MPGKALGCLGPWLPGLIIGSLRQTSASLSANLDFTQRLPQGILSLLVQRHSLGISLKRSNSLFRICEASYKNKLFFFFFFCFFRATLGHMEVPRLMVESELPAYTTAIATQDLSRICSLTQLMAMLDAQPPERGQGLNQNSHGYSLGLQHHEPQWESSQNKILIEVGSQSLVPASPILPS